MCEKILVARDESELAERVLAAAGDLASLSRGEMRETIYGHAAREIADDARMHDVGVIVMGSRVGATWPGCWSAARCTR